MPDILCKNRPVVCATGPSVDPSFPISNISSEDPDLEVFFARSTGYGIFGGNGDSPPIGSNWIASGCLGVCSSTISQADADACATQQWAVCVAPNWPQVPTGGNDPVTGDPQPETPLDLFGNDEQTCGVECPDGTEFTNVVPTGTYVAASPEVANSIAASVACNQAAQDAICLGELSPAYACLDTDYSGSVEATSSLPVTFTVGGLAPGLTASDENNVLTIEGIPTEAGEFNITVTAESASGSSVTKSFFLTVAAISNESPLPQASIDTAYSVTLVAVGVDEAESITWTIEDGALPDGLSLNEATGEISGTPTGTSANEFTAKFSTELISCSKEFMFVVGCSITTASLASGTIDAAYSETVAADGVGAGPVWSISSGTLPFGLSINAGTGEISGTPTYDDTFNFTVRVESTIDGQQSSCTKPLSIEVADNGVCLLVPHAAQDVDNWTAEAGNNVTPVPSGTGADASFDYSWVNPEDPDVNWEYRICNPMTDPYTLTFQLNVTGTVNLGTISFIVFEGPVSPANVGNPINTGALGPGAINVNTSGTYVIAGGTSRYIRILCSLTPAGGSGNITGTLTTRPLVPEP